MARRTREEIEEIIAARGSGGRSEPDPMLVKLLIGMMVGGLLLIIGVVAFRSEIRIYTGSATANDIYGACMSAAREGAANAKDQMAKAMIAGMMTEICTSMRDECAKAPTGRECTKIKEVAQMMARR